MKICAPRWGVMFWWDKGKKDIRRQKRAQEKVRGEYWPRGIMMQRGRTTDLLELLDSSLVDTTALVDQVAGSSGLATVDVCKARLEYDRCMASERCETYGQ